jgi:tRNA (cytosine38-C5)-methyltransferase
VGFESSGIRRDLHRVLTRRGYHMRELWVSPAQLGIPNQRTRYFLLASRCGALSGEPPAALAPMLLSPATLDDACDAGTPLAAPRGEVDADVQGCCAPLSDYLLPPCETPPEGTAIGDHILERYGASMDLVGRHSRRSCCFTKNYTRFIKGTGSIVCEAMPMSGSFPQEKTLDELRPLRLRFFAAREVANLHGFPPEFAFPATVGQKKQMELLGNSLSVQVLETLLRYLLACDKPGDGPQQRESPRAPVVNGDDSGEPE